MSGPPSEGNRCLQGRNAKLRADLELTAKQILVTEQRFAVRCVCSPLESTIFSSMTPEKGTNKLDAKLQEQEEAIVELQGKIAENKEAGEELKESLDHLEEVTEKIEKEND
jgi:hypothetical protein